MKKHGIVIKAHKNWNTKQIWNNGYLMRTYRHLPKIVNFKSNMVNDFNQHLCGGWNFKDIEDENATTIQRVIDGLKPLGTIYSLDGNRGDLTKEEAHAIKNNLVTFRQPNTTNYRWYTLTVCRKGTLSKLFDLDSLMKDYQDNFPEYKDRFVKEFNVFKNRELSSFFDAWDVDTVPIWVTGLILGYPIENTISCYKEKIKGLYA